MKEQIRLLIELQGVNAEMDILTAKRVGLPQEISKLGEEIERVDRELKEDGQRLEILRADHKAKETALKSGLEQIRKVKGRLLEVKTNKEYEALLKEIEIINNKGSVIEDEIINVLEEIDKVSEGLKAREGEVAGRRSLFEKEIAKMESELNSIGPNVQKIEKKTEEIRGKVKENTLKKFDVIKSRKGALAVVPVWKAVCEGCHMNIPPQMYNELQRNDRLMLCPHCERIIYWEDRRADA